MSAKQVTKVARRGGPLFAVCCKELHDILAGLSKYDVETELSLVQKLLYEYSELFPTEHPELPPPRSVELRIPVKEGTTPTVKQPYR